MKFTPGKVYRRKEIHDRYGGQRQGGASTPRDHPVVFIFTGETGEQYGYRDGFQDDGTFRLSGEGQVGDTQMIRGNRAIRDHEADGKKLHLFEMARKGRVQYLGEAVCLGHSLEPAKDREGNQRTAIVFDFDLQTEVLGVAELATPERRRGADGPLWRRSLAKLRALALQRSPKGASPRERRASTYQRSQAVRVYVLRRADGICEGCSSSAPFKTTQGRPYLEPHHIRRLADGGPDHPRWVAALCPNCHRHVHYGKNGRKLNEIIADTIDRLETTEA